MGFQARNYRAVTRRKTTEAPQKAAELRRTIARLESKLGKLSGDLEALKARVTRLESQ